MVGLQPASVSVLGLYREFLVLFLLGTRLVPPLLRLLLLHKKPSGLQLWQAIQALPQSQSHLAAEAPLPHALQMMCMHVLCL